LWPAAGGVSGPRSVRSTLGGAVGSRQVRAATHADLDVVIVVVVCGGRGAAAIARGHPPSALQTVAIRVRIASFFAQNRLVEISDHVVDAEPAHAPGVRAGRHPAIGEHLVLLVVLVVELFLRPILVALGFALPAVGQRIHFLTLAGKVPLALGANAFA